ncbi:helix-turn-helix domain-containing protein [Chitinophaga sp. SYP-B3965]|uniref:helix-turn-helix domain-containing protein n=1 Tax=Chitinophaga sp. SYP-B3965 TaxID=2663120 RepID=UPI001564E02B|nr:AraC family transcriptional regulator [Chitinophaga sp. SYP-B3965]
MKSTSSVFQGGCFTRAGRVPGETGPLILKGSDTNINQGRFGNVEPQYFSDHNYTVWVYNLELAKKEELTVKLPKVSAAMLYNLNGKATLSTCKSHQLELEEKSYSPLSLKPGHHTLKMNPGSCKILFLLFHPPYISPVTGSGPVAEECPLQSKAEANLINQTCQQLIEDVQRNDYSGELWRLKRQVLILDLFFKSLDEIGIPLQKEQPFEQHPDYERMVKVQVYIKENIDKKLSVQMLAEKFAIQPAQLRRTYLQVFKHQMWEYIRAERLHRSAVLLIETEMPVHEIAWEVGYESAAAFTRVFTFTFGQSPSDYRKSMQKKEPKYSCKEPYSLWQHTFAK